MDVRELREAIIENRFTSEQVVTVFAHRCFTLGRSLNIIAQEGFDTAIAMAREKDKLLAIARE
jgi:hypothetical protein